VGHTGDDVADTRTAIGTISIPFYLPAAGAPVSHDMARCMCVGG